MQEVETVDLCTSEDDEELMKLLKQFDLESVLPYLQKASVTYRSLRFMKQEDFKEAIPPLGLRMEFREKIFAWKKQKFGIDEGSMPVPSKVSNWLDTTKDQMYHGRFVLNKTLFSLLNETSKGRHILAYGELNKQLTNELREDIIAIIIEEVFINNIVLKTSDFLDLLAEICFLFPCETSMQDFYFIERGARTNASGKLYSKYKNKRNKKIKLSSVSVNSQNVSFSTNSCATESDEELIEDLKSPLKRYSADRDQVCENFKKPFQLSQSTDFRQWNKYPCGKVIDLVNMDFSIIHPNKEKSLLAKWELFKRKIRPFYEMNICNAFCKQLLAFIKAAPSVDTEDYLYCILLNAVLPSTVRFIDDSGKKTRKATITDSQESMVLRLTTLNNYEKKVDDTIHKFYSAGLTDQPFIIVVGMSDNDVSGFYIYFEKHLMKFNSFIECLDICFKIFHVNSLEYPKACQQSWLFLQKYFFNINTINDVKSSKLTSLLNFLKN